MIIGVGIDIVDINRIKESLVKFGDNFLKRVFSKEEIENSKKFTNLEVKSAFLAKRFVGKESFSKAIGLGIGRGIDFCDISIINDENGKPEVKLSKKAQDFLTKHLKNQNYQINISLTDEKEMAQSIVIISL